MKILALLKLSPRLFQATEDVQQKSWYTSKTILFNLIVLALDVALHVFETEIPVTGEEVDALAIAVAAVGNIVLRLVTTQPVGLSTKPSTGIQPASGTVLAERNRAE